jgi:hypothetical protein
LTSDQPFGTEKIPEDLTCPVKIKNCSKFAFFSKIDEQVKRVENQLVPLDSDGWPFHVPDWLWEKRKS